MKMVVCGAADSNGESGSVGACRGAIVWLWGWIVLKAWRSRDASALALLTAIFVINSVDYLFFYAPIYLAFWLAGAGFVAKEDANTKKTVQAF